MRDTAVITKILSQFFSCLGTNISFHLSAFLFLLAALIFLPPARADTPAFQTYTQRDGLAADYITSVAFASDGAVWIGTTRGARF
jgi:hypothetical protein